MALVSHSEIAFGPIKLNAKTRLPGLTIYKDTKLYQVHYEAGVMPGTSESIPVAIRELTKLHFGEDGMLLWANIEGGMRPNSEALIGFTEDHNSWIGSCGIDLNGLIDICRMDKVVAIGHLDTPTDMSANLGADFNGHYELMLPIEEDDWCSFPYYVNALEMKDLSGYIYCWWTWVLAYIEK
ncbi:hypothetical protein ES708_29120 [subsurface metagenome]